MRFPLLDFHIRTRLVKIFDPFVGNQSWKPFKKIVDRLDLESDEFFFVQIGSNDGVIHDPLFQYIRKYRWRGILVEPVAFYFKRLVDNYQHDERLIFENVAISDDEESRDLYKVKEGLDFLPKWTTGLGSFYLPVLLKHQWAIPDLEKYIVKEQVRCKTFNRLMEDHQVERIDLLMIDTEGYDFEIIKQIDFNRLKPATIIYERKHLVKTNLLECEKLLRDHRYSLISHLSNTIAYL